MSDELAATRADRDHWFRMWETARAELAAATKERDNWKAHAISRGKRLRRVSDMFSWIANELEDEGDRVYFGSSNHADEFRENIAWLHDFKWDKIMGEPENWDLLGSMEKARAELSAERERRKKAEADAQSCVVVIEQFFVLFWEVGLREHWRFFDAARELITRIKGDRL